jgi:SNF2 family DNA or RNA helicase
MLSLSDVLATSERAVYVPDSIGSILKPHQIEGVRFLWDNLIRSIKDVEDKKDPLGCILAHFMGLGKTLEAITFVDMFLRENLGAHAVIVVPVNTIYNWQNEFNKWIPDPDYDIYMLESVKKNSDRRSMVNSWKNGKGVLLIGYEMFRRLVLGIRIRHAQTKNDLFNGLTQVPDLIVLDEGHRIKNESNGYAKTLNMVKTTRRLILTGNNFF